MVLHKSRCDQGRRRLLSSVRVFPSHVWRRRRVIRQSPMFSISYPPIKWPSNHPINHPQITRNTSKSSQNSLNYHEITMIYGKVPLNQITKSPNKSINYHQTKSPSKSPSNHQANPNHNSIIKKYHHHRIGSREHLQETIGLFPLHQSLWHQADIINQ